jgi:hypothetical protein
MESLSVERDSEGIVFFREEIVDEVHP